MDNDIEAMMPAGNEQEVLQPHCQSAWQDRALAEKEPQTALTALVALARVGDKTLQGRLLDALDRLEWKSLSEAQKVHFNDGGQFDKLYTVR